MPFLIKDNITYNTTDNTRAYFKVHIQNNEPPLFAPNQKAALEKGEASGFTFWIEFFLETSEGISLLAID